MRYKWADLSKELVANNGKHLEPHIDVFRFRVVSTSKLNLRLIEISKTLQLLLIKLPVSDVLVSGQQFCLIHLVL